MSDNRRDQLAGSGATRRCDGASVGGDGDGGGRRSESPTGDRAVNGPAVRLLGRRPGRVFEHVPSWEGESGGRGKDTRSPETKAAFARALGQPWFPCMADLISCGLCTERVTPCLLSPETALGGIRRHTAGEQPWLLRVEDASRLLGLGRTRTWELIWKGDLPVIRMGRSVRIPREELQRWVQGRSAGGLDRRS
jgi:excisionase family DNA binding protein